MHKSVARFSVWFVLVTIAIFAAPLPLLAKEAGKIIDSTHARFRSTYEVVRLPASEKMGLYGATLMFDPTNWLSIGGGAYGALTGRRGGFITLGLSAEVRKALTDYAELNGGVFVGAGGGRGGYLLSGGGLMLRYHAGVALTSFDWGNLGVGYSFIDFPDGTIHSAQPYISYDYRYSMLLSPTWVKHAPQEYDGYRTLLNEQEFALVYKTYRIPSSVVQDNGTTKQYPTLNLLGAEWNHYLNDAFFVHFETEGAMGGQSSGYMQILLGGGLRVRLLDSTWLKLSTSLGVAGGGSVDTGGGLLLDGGIGVQQKLTEHVYAGLSADYVRSPGASFKALSYVAKLGYHFYTPTTVRRAYLSDLGGFDFNHMRIRATHQTYFSGSQNWRTRDRNLNVHLLGFQADYFVNRYIYLSGQSLAAYKGKAGAYMIGLAGLGAHLPVGPFFAEVEALGGAAGGGSLSVGSGLVWQGNATLGYQLNDKFSLMASYGYIKAVRRGQLRAKTLTLSLGYNFTLFTR